MFERALEADALSGVEVYRVKELLVTRAAARR
jgi:hypothetical protein